MAFFGLYSKKVKSFLEYQRKRSAFGAAVMCRRVIFFGMRCQSVRNSRRLFTLMPRYVLGKLSCNVTTIFS